MDTPATLFGNLKTMTVSVADRVATIAIDNPPINLVDPLFVRDVAHLINIMSADDTIQVVIFESADPDFFLAHYDMTALEPDTAVADAELERVQSTFAALSALPQVTIAKINGCARGGGAEFAWACDLRYAARSKTLLGQPEIGAGIIPGAGGTQRLPLLAGRGRALELILTGYDIDADEAERYGLITRALDEQELDSFVADVARRISRFPFAAIGAAKRSVDLALSPALENLRAETAAFRERLVDPEVARRVGDFLAHGGQTRSPAELDLGDLLPDLA